MKKIYALLFLGIVSFSFKLFDTTYHALTATFTQNWTDASLITTSDVWTGVTSIEGYRGDGLAGATGVDPQTILVSDDPGVIDVNANQTNPATFTTGGVTEFAIADPVVALSGSGTARAPYLKLYLNTTNRTSISVQYNLRDIDGSTDNAVQPVALQYRVGTSGSFTNIPAAFVADASSGPSLATLVTPVSVILPAACDNQPQVQLRIMTTDAVGNDEWIGIDDINITSTPLGGSDVSVTNTVATGEGAADGSFTFTFSPATTGTSAINYAFTGTATYGTDYTVSFSAGTNPGTASGTLSNIPASSGPITVTIHPEQDIMVEGTETITFTLSGPPAGYTIGTAAATMNFTDDDVAPTVSVAAGVNAAEPSTNGSFTINFNTPTTSSTTLDFAYTGTASFTSDYGITYSTGTTPSTTSTGTLTVPGGVSSVTVNVIPVDDPDVEPTETIILTISNPGGGYALGTASASINITSNDVVPTVSAVPGNNAGEPSTNGTFTITLSSPAPVGGITATYTLTGTATQNTDYTDAQSGTVTILQGTSSATVNINVINDNTVEQAETITLTINTVTSPYTIATSAASILLTEDDIAPISLTTLYTQDFNSLANTGTANAWTLTGWGISESGGGARDNEVYAADNGSSTTGDTYSYGTTGQTDRALGSLASGTLNSMYGAYFVNNTGVPATRVRISYTGEQWRLGTINRQDRLAFQYSLNATTLNTGNWVNYNTLDFLTPATATPTGAKDGNVAGNRTAIAYTITGLSIPNGGTFFIRFRDIDTTGADDGLSIDDFSIEINPADAVPPAAVSFSPAPASTGNAVYIPAAISFNEDIAKGTGNIIIRRNADNVIVQTINVSASSVTIDANKVNFIISGLDYNTAYYVEVEAGALTDVPGNSFAGFSGSSTWSFTTRTAPAAGIVGNLYNFNTCAGPVPDGFTEFSVTGATIWTCTNFGHNPNRPDLNTSDSIYGLQINGFSAGSNFTNEDWLISPSFNLTATDYPLLSFFSRTAFNGSTLQLKVSTDYVAGNPAAATWVDLNGKFPGLATNVWKRSFDINLRAYRQANVHFAFVYTSSDQDGARWTLDEILLENSAVPPPPSLSISTTDIQFGFAAAGGGVVKSFTVTGNDITGNIDILPVTSDFTVSLSPGGPFVPMLSLAQATYNNVPTPIYVRFGPAANSQNFSSYMQVSTSGVTTGDTVFLKGTSIDPINTLEIVNWNLEWFGSPVNGPTNKPQQEANVQAILQNIGADLFGVVEVVDEAALARVVGNMPGYSYRICDFGSHTNPFDPIAGPQSLAQKEAFIYKTSMFSNITTAPLVTNGVNTLEDYTSNPAFNYFSSGRYPFMMKADVNLNGITKIIRFVLLHAKADTDNGSYPRRKNGSDTLKYTLNNLYPNDNIILFGDINDDLDSTIAEQINPRITSYIAFMADTVTTFKAPTLALSLAGKKSTVGYNDMIDHVIVSNEMSQFYMGNSATVLTDVSSLVTNYGNTTTDHYPIFTRYAFDAIILPVKLLSFAAVKTNTVTKITWSTSQEINSKHFIVERSANGTDWTGIATVAAAGNSSIQLNYAFTDLHPARGLNLYRLRSVDIDNKIEFSAIRKVNFDADFTYSIYPNPAKDKIYITIDNAGVINADVQVINAQGQVMISQRMTGVAQPAPVDIAKLTPGMYFVKIVSADGVVTMEKMIKQ